MARPLKYESRTVDDLTHTRWCSMHSRVKNQDRHKHATIDPEWYDYLKFKEDMGECPIGYSLERNNNSLGYNKNNCRWIPNANQSKNRRCNIIHYGMPLKELAEKVGVNYKVIWYRVQRMKLTIDEAILYKPSLQQKLILEGIRDTFNNGLRG